MNRISYFETFINSKTFLKKENIDDKLKKINDKYFKKMVGIKQIPGLNYGGWEIRAKGLKDQWVKAYVIEEGFTFKIYWCNSNEFLRWVATIIMHELALEYGASVFSGKNLEVIEPEKSWFKTFREYIKHIDNSRDARDLPEKIKNVFNIDDSLLI